MRVHCDNAMRVAEFLNAHPRVKLVHFPGLASHPGHALAKSQMSAFGAMMSFAIDGTAEDAMRFAEKCRVFKMAASLGGVESLMSYPPKLSHAGLSEEQRLAIGIPPTLLRVSVGIEDADDLIEDLSCALGA
jgi:cystathionine beta-lyase/cystathionine gamma-synthase